MTAGRQHEIAVAAEQRPAAVARLPRADVVGDAGDDDPIIPLANARLMNLLMPRSRMHIYHGGHLGLATEAAELAPVVDAFLAAP